MAFAFTGQTWTITATVIELVMELMEIFAAVVGFVAALTQVWEVLGKRRRPAGEA